MHLKLNMCGQKILGSIRNIRKLFRSIYVSTYNCLYSQHTNTLMYAKIVERKKKTLLSCLPHSLIWFDLINIPTMFFVGTNLALWENKVSQTKNGGHTTLLYWHEKMEKTETEWNRVQSIKMLSQRKCKPSSGKL